MRQPEKVIVQEMKVLAALGMSKTCVLFRESTIT